MISHCIFLENEAGRSGGAIAAISSHPMITETEFTANICYTKHGGAIYSQDNQPMVSYCTFTENTAPLEGGAIYLENALAIISPENSFINNRGCGGSDLAADRNTGEVINLTNNSFSGNATSSYFVSPQNRIDVTGHISSQQLIAADLFVASDGDDELNDGLTPATPFKTIRHAMSRIETSTTTPFTIHLAAGEFSLANTGEIFPIPLLSSIVIQGETDSSTVINSENNNGLFRSAFGQDKELSYLTLTGTFGPILYLEDTTGTYNNLIIDTVSNTSYGAGLFSDNSISTFTNCNFQNCLAANAGGAAYVKNGSTLFEQCIFEENSATHQGGAICAKNEVLTVTGCDFLSNQSPAGGAIRVDRGTTLLQVSACAFDDNFSPRGANLSAASIPQTPLSATDNTFDISPDCARSVAPVTAFDTSNAIVTGPQPLPGATVYVSEDGDNINDGLTPDTAFRTISHALMRVIGSASAPATVNVAPGIYTSSSGERFPLSLTPDITLAGAGSDHTYIDAESGNAVVAYYSDNSVLDGFSLTTSNDSCIVSEYSSAEISNIRVHDCDSTANGAGLIASNSSLQIVQSRFENNHTHRQGGAIQASTYAELSIVDCEFTANTSRQHGGGVLIGYNGAADILGCLFQDNVANSDGGGLAAFFGIVHVGDCQFVGNTAGFMGGGALITSSESDLGTLANTFSDNRAAIGADLAADELFNTPVNLGTSHFSGIPDSAFYISPGEAFDRSQVTGTLLPIQQDVYVSPDGSNENTGLTPDSPFQTIRYAMERVLPLSAGSPLTINLMPGTHVLAPEGPIHYLPLLDHLLLTGAGHDQTILDASNVNGAFFGYFTQYCHLNNLTLRDSLDSALESYFCNLALTDCHFIGNNGAGSGGALSISGGTTLILNSLFSDNYSSSNGGAIDARQHAFLLMESTTFIENQASSSGGALSTWLCRGWLNNCDFLTNYSQQGGAWSSRQDYGLELTGSRILNNEAALGGGGSIFWSEMSLTDCLIVDNVSNPVTGVNGHGAGVYIDNSVTGIHSCTIASNDAMGFSRISGGGVCVVANSTVSIINSILRQNRGNSGSDIQIGFPWNSTSTDIDYSNADLTNPTAVTIATGSQLNIGDNNLTDDPMFVSGHHDWQLSSVKSGQVDDSPCIDAGPEPALLFTYLAPLGIVNTGWRSTVTGSWPDTDWLDQGYHHPLPAECQSGDVNADGDITFEDAQLAFLMAFDPETEDYSEICVADMNFDQRITMDDVQELWVSAGG